MKGSHLDVPKKKVHIKKDVYRFGQACRKHRYNFIHVARRLHGTIWLLCVVWPCGKCRVEVKYTVELGERKGLIPTSKKKVHQKGCIISIIWTRFGKAWKNIDIISPTWQEDVHGTLSFFFCVGHVEMYVHVQYYSTLPPFILEYPSGLWGVFNDRLAT